MSAGTRRIRASAVLALLASAAITWITIAGTATARGVAAPAAPSRAVTAPAATAQTSASRALAAPSLAAPSLAAPSLAAPSLAAQFLAAQVLAAQSLAAQGLAAQAAPAQAAVPPARVDPPPSLGFEGALDNDTARPCNDAATLALAGADPTQETEALEGWRRALVASAPGDPECSDARRSTSIDRFVRGAIGTAHAAAFAERFESLARAALDAAGHDDGALERVEHENPFTRAAASASLRRFDLAFERGARAPARAALERARANSAWRADAELDAAIAARANALGPPLRARDDWSALDAAQRLRVQQVLELDPQASEDPAWHLQPSGAAAADGRVWIQSAENLIEIDAQSHAQRHDPREILSDLGATWLPAFGDEDAPWLQRPAVDPGRAARIALVLGRAKDARGNALCVLDVSGRTPRATWVHAETGFAHADGTRMGEDAALLPGRLEFEPGPVLDAGLVIAQVLQWLQPSEPPVAQHVEAAKTTAWLVAFDAASGRVAWQRRLATGADRRARSASRFASERGLSCPCLPLALQDDTLVAVTELGIFARHSALDGELIDAWRMRRARIAGGERAGRGGPVAMLDAPAEDRSVALAPADSGGVVYLDGDARAQPLAVRIEGLEAVVGATGEGADERVAVLVRADSRRRLDLLAPATQAVTSSIALPRGSTWHGSVAGSHVIACAYAGVLGLFDLRRDLALTARIDLPGSATEGACGLFVHAARAYVVGTRRGWVIALE